MSIIPSLAADVRGGCPTPSARRRSGVVRISGRDQVRVFGTHNIGPGGGGAAPAISGFTPMSGAPGTAVTVTGSNFPTNIADVTVTLSGVTAPVTSASSTQLNITVPSMGNATGPISVVTPSGNATSSASFTVIVP